MVHIRTAKECLCSLKQMFLSPVFSDRNVKCFQCRGTHVQPITCHTVWMAAYQKNVMFPLTNCE